MSRAHKRSGKSLAGEFSHPPQCSYIGGTTTNLSIID